MWYTAQLAVESHCAKMLVTNEISPVLTQSNESAKCAYVLSFGAIIDMPQCKHMM